MKESFYYFFSATPQVLGAILALFGVFVIFKLQALKSYLIGISKSILNHIETKPAVAYEDKMEKAFIPIRLREAIQIEDIKKLKSIIDKIQDKGITSVLDDFRAKFDFRNSLIKDTIKWSIFTAAIIIACLTIVSQGDYFVDHSCLLSITFWVVIGLITACFTGFIYILIKSLKES